MSAIAVWILCGILKWHNWYELDWGDGWVRCVRCGRVDLWLGEEK